VLDLPIEDPAELLLRTPHAKRDTVVGRHDEAEFLLGFAEPVARRLPRAEMPRHGHVHEPWMGVFLEAATLEHHRGASLTLQHHPEVNALMPIAVTVNEAPGLAHPERAPLGVHQVEEFLRVLRCHHGDARYLNDG
jgi:hypothetical protein